MTHNGHRENNYIATLAEIVQGYLIPMRKEFASLDVSRVFLNVEKIASMHKEIQESLRLTIARDDVSVMAVGTVYKVRVCVGDACVCTCVLRYAIGVR